MLEKSAKIEKVGQFLSDLDYYDVLSSGELDKVANSLVPLLGAYGLGGAALGAGAGFLTSKKEDKPEEKKQRMLSTALAGGLTGLGAGLVRHSGNISDAVADKIDSVTPASSGDASKLFSKLAPKDLPTSALADQLSRAESSIVTPWLGRAKAGLGMSLMGGLGYLGVRGTVSDVDAIRTGLNRPISRTLPVAQALRHFDPLSPYRLQGWQERATRRFVENNRRWIDYNRHLNSGPPNPLTSGYRAWQAELARLQRALPDVRIQGTRRYTGPIEIDWLTGKAQPTGRLGQAIDLKFPTNSGITRASFLKEKVRSGRSPALWALLSAGGLLSGGLTVSGVNDTLEQSLKNREAQERINQLVAEIQSRSRK
jgi:hypothetical protein